MWFNNILRSPRRGRLIVPTADLSAALVNYLAALVNYLKGWTPI